MEETERILAETLLRRNTQVGFAINVFFYQQVVLTY
jgi:hypothetical protein